MTNAQRSPEFFAAFYAIVAVCCLALALTARSTTAAIADAAMSLVNVALACRALARVKK